MPAPIPLPDLVEAARQGELPAVLDRVKSAALAMPQVDCPVRHHFAPGLYVRELQMPAGTFAIGHRHKFAHLNILMEGKVLVLNDDGTTRELAAPAMFIGEPGRKVGVVLENMTWLNIYATDERDVATLEATLLEADGEFKAAEQQRARSSLPLDRADFHAALAAVGVTHADADAEALREDNVVPLPPGSYLFKTASSPIHGRGIFATGPIEPGERIGPMRIGNSRTPLGRYVNHSADPNARPVRVPGGIDLEALREIRGCQGGFQGDEITIDYRKALALAVQLNQECDK